MKIIMLGTRGEIEESAPYHSKRSGVLLDGMLLLDCGDVRFLHHDPRAILITHLHPDHAYFVRHQEVPPSEVSIYAPESYEHGKLQVVHQPFKIGAYVIKPIPTIHSIKVTSQAYLIEHRGKRILYTGDMIWIEQKYHQLLHNLDAVITEASYMRSGGMVRRDKKTGQIFGHTGVPNLVRLFSQFTQTMIFGHFGAWFYKDMKDARKKFKELAREYDMNLIVGYDGLEIEL